MLLQHHSSSSVFLMARELKATSIITKSLRMFRYLLTEQSAEKEVLVINAVIRPIREDVFLG